MAEKKYIDENGNYLDPMAKASVQEAGAALAGRIIKNTTEERISPQSLIRMWIEGVGDARVGMSDGTFYQFVNDECNVWGKHLDEMLGLGAKRIKQDRGQFNRVVAEDNR
jgi:hypothetical protein